MIRTLALSLGLLLAITSAQQASAQIVRVGGWGWGGGVSVRAPFVSVDVLPYGGGARVHAPFTAVRTGAYRFGPYVYSRHHHRYHHYYAPPVVYGAVPVVPVAPVVPVLPAAPVAVYEAPVVYPEVAASYASSTQPIPERLRDSAARLAQSLALRRNDADVWLDYLGPEQIVGVIEQNADPASLRELVRHYDGVVGNPGLVSVQSASGFAETRSLLKQFVTMSGRSVAKPSAPPAAPSDAPADVPVPAPADEPEAPEPAPILPPQPDRAPQANESGDAGELIKTATGIEEIPTPL